MAQAANQYTNGFPASALALVTKVLACKQDTRVYRIAALYACAAHDGAAARALFAKLPPQFQAPIEQKCQQEGTSLRGP
jgi:dTDP-4-dehydrorhamnose reductase